MTRKEAGQVNNMDAIERLERKITRYSEELSMGEKFTPLLFDNGDIDALNLAIKALRDADNAADVFYICDHKSCIKGTIYGAHACEPCMHTRNIRHAANFSKLIDNDGRVLAYFEHAETDEGGGAHD